jgi:ABC-type branched-subunit amino acid transport system substrate-binding protein
MKRTTAWRSLGGASALVMVMLIAACGSSGASGGNTSAGGSPGVDVATHTITIGAVEPLTGPNAVYGENAFGTEAYIDYVNAHGGVHGWKIKFTTLDDQYEPALAVSGARELVSSDHVFALVGVGGTPPGQAILPYAIQTGVPDIGMTMDTGYLQVKYPDAAQLYGFQPSTAALTAFSVQYLATKLHATKIGLFYSDDATGTPTVPAAQDIASKYHVTIVPVPIPDSATDYSGYVAKMASAKPQAVISWGGPPVTIGVIKAASAINFKPTWFGPFYNPLPPVFSALGSLANNMYFESWFEPFGADTPGMQTFISATKQYTSDKNPSFLAELGWIGGAEFVHALTLATAGGKTPTRASVESALGNGQAFSPGNVEVSLKFQPGARLATAGSDKVLRYSGGKLTTVFEGPDPTLSSSVLNAAYGGS